MDAPGRVPALGLRRITPDGVYAGDRHGMRGIFRFARRRGPLRCGGGGTVRQGVDPKGKAVHIRTGGCRRNLRPCGAD